MLSKSINKYNNPHLDKPQDNQNYNHPKPNIPLNQNYQNHQNLNNNATIKRKKLGNPNHAEIPKPSSNKPPQLENKKSKREPYHPNNAHNGRSAKYSPIPVPVKRDLSPGIVKHSYNPHSPSNHTIIRKGGSSNNLKKVNNTGNANDKNEKIKSASIKKNDKVLVINNMMHPPENNQPNMKQSLTPTAMSGNKVKTLFSSIKKQDIKKNDISINEVSPLTLNPKKNNTVDIKKNATLPRKPQSGIQMGVNHPIGNWIEPERGDPFFLPGV